MIEILAYAALIGLGSIFAYAAAFFVFMLAVSAYTLFWRALALATLPGSLRTARAAIHRNPRKVAS